MRSKFAIPAVATYNFFVRQMKATLANTEVLTRVLLAHLAGQHPGKTRDEVG